jgi:hypothetical protein
MREVPMKWSRLFVFASVIALGMSPALAQESTVLQIEVTRDGSLVAKPQLRLQPGREGRLDLNGEWAGSNLNPLLKGLRESIRITPTVRGEDVTLAFNINSGDKQFRPSLMISKDLRGSLEWTGADGQPVMLTVSWVQ